MASNQTLEVDLIGKSIALRYTDDQNGTKNWEYHPVCRIVSITGNVQIGFGTRDPNTLQQKQRYRYEDMLRVIIELDGPHQPDIDFDLNQVSNQAGWTLDEAGVQQAIADINTWAGSCNDSSGAPATGLATETKQDALIAELVKMIDFEISCVVDTVTDVVYLMNVEKNETTGAIAVTYIDAQGNTVVPPTPANLVVCDSSAAMALLLAELQAVNGTDGVAHGAGQQGQRALGTDGTNDQQLSTDAAGQLQIDVVTSALPTGAATELTLGNLLTELQLKADLTETQPVSLATTVRTPSYDIVTTAGAGSVAGGARSVSIKNNGPVAVTVLGTSLPVGESISFDAGAQGDTLGAIAYNIAATGSIQILKVV